MSIFIDNNSVSPQGVSQQRLELAEFQYDALNGLLETIRKTCCQKCIPLDYGEGDLTKGESECTNRCVAKFMEGHKVIGNLVETGRKLTDKDLKHYEQIKRDYLSGPPDASSGRWGLRWFLYIAHWMKPCLLAAYIDMWPCGYHGPCIAHSSSNEKSN